MNKPSRLEIYSNDIQQIKDCSARRAREILKDMKEHYRKERHQIITPEEAAKYLGIKLETLLAFLFSLLLCISPITAQDNFWHQVRYFSPEEFYVNGEISQIDPDLVIFLDEVRSDLGQPIRISSAVRSSHYNKQIGGKEGSDHIQGLAVDIITNSPTYRASLINSILLLSTSISQPVKLVIYSTHLHLSVSATFNQIYLGN